ncbi:MAG TPA: uridine kinase [Firmicutes bacterium]|jgi:uridine kinase|nr:uridine kinase [Bacillota bacterium]
MLIIGIAGGTGSGKSTVAEALQKELSSTNVALISQDSYYADLSDLPFEERAKRNYDHPDAFENSLLIKQLDQIRKGKTIEVPVYDFSQHARTTRKIPVAPHPVIVVEGILILNEPALRKAFDIKVYVDTDADTRVIRRITRDIEERGRTLDSVCRQYLNTVKPMHEAFIEPSKRYADIIIPVGGHNTVALSLLVSRIESYLNSIEISK